MLISERFYVSKMCSNSLVFAAKTDGSLRLQDVYRSRREVSGWVSHGEVMMCRYDQNTIEVSAGEVRDQLRGV